MLPHPPDALDLMVCKITGDFICTGLPHYNSPHYNTHFIITQSCLGPQMVIFPLF